MDNLVISTNKTLRYSILLFLYFIQGFPVGVFFLTIPAWLAENQTSVADIGYFTFMTTLPWTLKFINGFIIDRFTYLPMGRRRAWLLAAFLFIIITLISYASVSPSPEQLSLLATFSLMVMLGTAIQDTAIDAMAADLVQEEELSIANGLMFGGQIIGVASGTASIGYLISNFGFATGIYTLASIIGLAVLVMLFVRERPNEKLLPWSSGAASPLSEQLQVHDMREIIRSASRAMWNLPSLQLVTILFLISLNYGIYLSIFPKIATDIAGLDTANISYIGGVASLVAGLVCIFVIGTLGDKFGKKTIIIALLLLQCVLTIAGLLLQAQWDQLSVLYGAAIITAITRYGLLTLIAAIAMSWCNPRVAATQFTLYLAFTNLGMAIAATLVGSLDKWGGFFASFAAYGLIALVALVVAFFLKGYNN
jgi:PAT family beta-lactamase induction signal transducer AmpG